MWKCVIELDIEIICLPFFLASSIASMPKGIRFITRSSLLKLTFGRQSNAKVKTVISGTLELFSTAW